MSDLLQRLSEALARNAAEGIFRQRRTIDSDGPGWCRIQGRRICNFAANDYLGFAHDPRLLAAAQLPFAAGVGGAGASPLVCGRTRWHEELEAELAAFERTEAAILFPTGMAANLGTLAALIGPDDLICCDRLNHASLVDGCRLSRGKLTVYRHDDLARLERTLQQSAAAPARWIVTDTVFSMDGDRAPLAELASLAARYHAELIVDEAHATGVLGPTGRGLVEELALEEQITVRIGTLSKAIGSLGGFVAGPQTLIDYLWNHARTQIYSTALPPNVCAAATAAVRMLRSDPTPRQRLIERCALFRQLAEAAGLPIPPGVEGPIFPIILGDSQQTVATAANLLDAGYLVGAIRPPTVPQGTARLRISVSAAHTSDDVAGLVQCLTN